MSALAGIHLRDVALSVYGASFARQLHDHIAAGRGPGDDDDRDQWHEEAESVAEVAVEALMRARGRDSLVGIAGENGGDRG